MTTKIPGLVLHITLKKDNLKANKNTRLHKQAADINVRRLYACIL